jgi:asparagine synthase (glutamine-hydrolysing)
VVAGSAADAGPLDVSGAATPLEAIERVVLPALEQTPCCVSFSGGRDSSLVLAVAASLARRTALPQPVPVTNVFPAAPQSHENEWQELVVRRLGLKEWVRLEHKDELDLVGPVAGAALRRHGLCFPFNAFFHVPLLEVANGGSLLTGVGGDESLGGVRRYQRVLALNARPRPSDVARIAALALPASARRALRRRRMQVPTPWLTEAATRALTAVIAEMNDRFSAPLTATSSKCGGHATSTSSVAHRASSRRTRAYSPLTP